MLFRLLYRLGLFIYHGAIRLVALWQPKAQAWVNGRKDWEGQLLQWRKQQANTPVLWMHCASLGEFEQGRPVLEGWRARYPEHKIVLTFYSPSGYKQRKNYAQADYIGYLPADGPRNAKRWLKILRPDVAIFVKYEFWYYHLATLRQNQVPTYLIAASFRPEQVFFRWYGGAFRKLLAGFHHIFVQHASDLPLLQSIGIEQATVAGDPRLDRTLQIAAEVEPIPVLAQFKANERLFIAGSSWPPDEDILLTNATLWSKDWKLLLVPHDIGEKHIKQIEQRVPLPYLRYSQLDEQADLSQVRILILDTIGLLARAYAYGDMAYIGGGFGSGLHNTLEPTAHGLPVLFGPKYHKFPEAVHFATQGGGAVVKDAADFQQKFHRWADDGQAYQNAKSDLASYFAQAQGATERVLVGIERMIS